MRNPNRFTLLVSLLCGVCVSALVGQTPGTRVRTLLPRPRFNVEVLELWTPPRLTLLTQRLQQAVQADPTWWQEHVRRAVPGEPLPYDPKLGLSEPEYRELLSLNDSIQMKPGRTVEVVLEPTPVGWRFGAGNSLTGLRNIVIDTTSNMVHSPFGDLSAADPITPSAEQTATGPWGGPRWSLEAVDTTSLTGTIAQFAIGKHEQTGRTIIYYDAKRLEKGQVSAQASLFLRVAP